MNRPNSIINFERCFWTSLLLGFGSLLLHWQTAIGALKQDPALSQTVDAAIIAVGIAFGFTVALSILLWYLISRRASKVAKWIYVVLMAFGIVSTITSFADPTSPKGFALAISLASTVLTALSIYLLFRPDAVAWFDHRPVDPETFR